MFFAVGYDEHLDAQIQKHLHRSGGTENEEPCCVVGTGAKIWTFSQSVGRKVSTLGVINGEEGKKNYKGP